VKRLQRFKKQFLFIYSKILFFVLLVMLVILYPQINNAKQIGDINQMVSLINSYRERNGMEKLNVNNKLVESSDKKNLEIITSGKFEHTDPINLYPLNLGYNSLLLSELLSEGFPNEESIFNHWRTSPEHEMLLLDPRFCEVGYAMQTQSKQGKDLYIATLYLGTPIGGCVDSSSSSNTSSSTNSGIINTTQSIKITSQVSQVKSVNSSIISVSEQSRTSESSISKVSNTNDQKTTSTIENISQVKDVEVSTSNKVELTTDYFSSSTSSNINEPLSMSETSFISFTDLFSTQSMSSTPDEKSIQSNDSYAKTIPLVVLMSTIGLSLMQIHKVILFKVLDKFPVR